MTRPTEAQLFEALKAAGAAHHDYEAKALGGEPDARWSGWYAAYALGRLGDFATPTDLSGWLADAPGSDDWASSAAAHVTSRLAGG